jgi:hypothetical protein
VAHTNNSLLLTKNKSFYKKPSKSIPTLNIRSSVTHNRSRTSHNQHGKLAYTTATNIKNSAHNHNQTNSKPQSKPKTNPKNQPLQQSCAHKNPQPQPKGKEKTKTKIKQRKNQLETAPLKQA